MSLSLCICWKLGQATLWGYATSYMVNMSASLFSRPLQLFQIWLLFAMMSSCVSSKFDSQVLSCFLFASNLDIIPTVWRSWCNWAVRSHYSHWNKAFPRSLSNLQAFDHTFAIGNWLERGLELTPKCAVYQAELVRNVIYLLTDFNLQRVVVVVRTLSKKTRKGFIGNSRTEFWKRLREN